MNAEQSGSSSSQSGANLQTNSGASSLSASDILVKPFDLHVLVCTNTRAPLPPPADGSPAPPQKASCGPLGAEEIRAELKSWLHGEIKSRPSLAGKVRARVNGSGCLDFCKKGIVIALYPQSEFLLYVKNTSESVAAVKQQIILKLEELEKSV